MFELELGLYGHQQQGVHAASLIALIMHACIHTCHQVLCLVVLLFHWKRSALLATCSSSCGRPIRKVLALLRSEVANLRTHMQVERPHPQQ